MKSPSKSLRCPRCGAEHPLDERFCSQCGFPLVYAGYEKIDPEYTRGELIRVAGGRNQAEAELIQNLLLEEGIPSIVKRSAGFDVPDYLAGGPRDVLVAESAVQAAREMLLEADLAPQEFTEADAQGLVKTTFVVVGIVAAAMLLVYGLWLLLPD
jgi:zinc-ribbon domain/Putative prokaryotic signal transducing protein